MKDKLICEAADEIMDLVKAQAMIKLPDGGYRLELLPVRRKDVEDILEKYFGEDDYEV